MVPFARLGMGQWVTLVGKGGVLVRCRLAGRVENGSYLFAGGDVGAGRVLRTTPGDGWEVAALDWFEDADVVQLVPAA